MILEIALVCGLKNRVACQNRVCVNSDVYETLAYWESRCVSEVLPHSCERTQFLMRRIFFKLTLILI